jgi:hypothetical protein
MAYVSFFLIFLSGGAHLGAGIIVMQGIVSIDDAIYKQTNIQALEDSFTSRVVHLQLSMFNGCCASKGWSKEKFQDDDEPDAVDLDGFVKHCDSLKEANLDSMDNSGLRTCYDYQEEYRKFNYTVGNNMDRICSTLEGAQTDITGKLVPGISFEIEVSSLTGGDTLIPVAGDLEKPTYGCGIGYAKAFQAAMLIWTENKLVPIQTGFLACGIVEILLLVIAVLTNYSCNVQTESTADAYARYTEEIAQSSQKPPGQFEHQGHPDRSSVANPVYYNNNSGRMDGSSSGNHHSQHSQQQRQSQQYQQPMPQSLVAFNVDDKI